MTAEAAVRLPPEPVPGIDQRVYLSRVSWQVYEALLAWRGERSGVRMKDEAAERGAEADECYVLGSFEGRSAPDIAIEVVWTSGGLDKLEVWRKLGAREVWFWAHGALSFHVLRGRRYVRSDRSLILPKLDPALITRCMDAPSQVDAVKQLRRAMRATPRKRRRP